MPSSTWIDRFSLFVLTSYAFMLSYRPHHRLLPVVVLAALFLLSSCDTTDIGGGNTVTLTASVVQGDFEPLSFQFDSSDIAAGRLVDLPAMNSLDLTAFLRDRGFERSEIVRARVTAATLEVIFPITETVSFLNTAILKLTAQGISDTEVAEQSNFPSGNIDEAPLVIRPNRDIANFLSRQNFSAILQIDAATLRPDAEYEIAVSLTLSIDVEGF